MSRFETIRNPLMRKELLVLARKYPELAGENGLPPTSDEFTYHVKGGDNPPGDWKGRWCIYALGKRYAELDIDGTGFSYAPIVGRNAFGLYLCLPGWRVSCPLADGLQDYYGNFRELAACMDPYHVTCVLRGLEDFSRKTGWDLI